MSGSPSDGFFLTLAAKEGNAEVLALFLSKNPALAFSAAKDKSTAWHYAAQNGHLDILELLLSTVKSASVSNTFDPVSKVVGQKNVNGETPLMLACGSGREEAVTFLLSHGADVWATDSVGKTCLHYAAWGGNNACVRLVLSKAAKEPISDLEDQGSTSRFVNLADSFGRTALHFVAWSGQTRACSALMNTGANLTSQTLTDCYSRDLPCNAGTTALHVAALKGHEELVVCLLGGYVHAIQSGSKPADPRTFLDKYGTSPYALASMRERSDLARLLNPNTVIAELLDVLPPSAIGHHPPRSTPSAYSRVFKVVEDARGFVRSVSKPAASSNASSSPQASPAVPTVSPLATAVELLAEQETRSDDYCEEERPLPSYFLCPLTGLPLSEPVVASDGFTYERSALDRWLQDGNTTSPLTGEALQGPPPGQCFPNNALLLAMKDWQRSGHSRKWRAGSPSSEPEQAFL